MSFTDRLVLWLHIGFAIFTIGPVALAISSSPRYIRRRDVPVLRYLSRITLIFTTASLLVLVFGIVLGQLDHDFDHPWLTVAMTLFIVAIVLLVLIIRDQRSAIRAITPAAATAQAAGEFARAPAAGSTAAGSTAAGSTAAGDAAADTASAGATDASSASSTTDAAGQPARTLAEHIASVERGRIAAMGGVVNLIWLVILALMVWRP
jgi:hypothetical protein